MTFLKLPLPLLVGLWLACRRAVRQPKRAVVKQPIESLQDDLDFINLCLEVVRSFPAETTLSRWVLRSLENEKDRVVTKKIEQWLKTASLVKPGASILAVGVVPYTNEEDQVQDATL